MSLQAVALHRSTAKLGYVAATIFTGLVREGFCTPPATQEGPLLLHHSCVFQAGHWKGSAYACMRASMRVTGQTTHETSSTPALPTLCVIHASSQPRGTQVVNTRHRQQ